MSETLTENKVKGKEVRVQCAVCDGITKHTILASADIEGEEPDSPLYWSRSYAFGAKLLFEAEHDRRMLRVDTGQNAISQKLTQLQDTRYFSKIHLSKSPNSCCCSLGKPFATLDIRQKPGIV
ncbi:hypothetical protein D3C87_1752530 [compost metagenome]